MYKVDIINGNDDNDCSYNSVFQTLSKAIEISKSGDTIFLYPGTYDFIDVSSKTKHFELKIKGSGSNTVCSRFLFSGFFDLTFEDILIENFEVISTSSNFYFKNVKFAGLNTLLSKKYHQILNDEPRTCFVFDECKFERNFQIQLQDGNHIVSIKTCDVRGKIPLILCKKTSATIKLTNINFDDPILFNNNSFVDIQHTGCNFICPIYTGKDTLIYTKDNYISPSIDGGRLYDSPYIFKQNTNKETNDINENSKGIENSTLKNKSTVLKKYLYEDEEVELYGGIQFNSFEFKTLKVHRVTRFIRITGSIPVELFLPKNPINGHTLTVYTDSVIIIDGIEYHNKLINISYTINGGYFFYPDNLFLKNTENRNKFSISTDEENV
uniref:DUF1565 domain-containing protein n=1 Tax=viral metagenome TaxID=1070528 RepID=A0A6C0BD97_9ZZZZ